MPWLVFSQMSVFFASSGIVASFKNYWSNLTWLMISVSQLRSWRKSEQWASYLKLFWKMAKNFTLIAFPFSLHSLSSQWSLWMIIQQQRFSLCWNGVSFWKSYCATKVRQNYVSFAMKRSSLSGKEKLED